MFEKTFQEMRQVDISKFVKRREGSAEYLPWAKCKDLLHDYGAEVVMFRPVPGPDGSSLRRSDLVFRDKNGVENRCYEVVVHIQVDNLEWDITYPVMNGPNPVKDNSMNQRRVDNAVRRAFVKGIAERTGLGFGLWVKEDELPEPTDDLSAQSLAKCKRRLEETITEKLKRMPLDTFYQKIGLNKSKLDRYLAYYDSLDKLERMIEAVQP